MQFWIVDSFTATPYAGNPAGVIIVDEFPSDRGCQNMASEINLSETAFIKPLGKDHYHLRWFTPGTEVKLCGHATLAAGHILFQQQAMKGDEITFESLSGLLRVLKSADGLTLDFPLQSTGPDVDKAYFSKIVGVDIVSAVQALDDVIIELATESLVRSFKPNIEKINQVDCRGLIITAKGDDEYDFVSRFFAPRVGVDEDPVTGSAHCKLADYWQKKLNKNEFHAYQASKRGGDLKLNIKGERVYITGQAVTISRGEWLV